MLESVLREFDHYLVMQWQFQPQKDRHQVLAAQLYVFLSA
jgi:hypothetical protein